MLIVVLMRSNIVIVGLLAGLSLAVGCATDEDYYEGEVVPTRPISKPSLDPSQPAELTGSTTPAPNDLPTINEAKQPGVDPKRDFYIDGRVGTAEDVIRNGELITVVTYPGFGAADYIEILDENGNLLDGYVVSDRASATKIDIGGVQ